MSDPRPLINVHAEDDLRAGMRVQLQHCGHCGGSHSFVLRKLDTRKGLVADDLSVSDHGWIIEPPLHGRDNVELHRTIGEGRLKREEEAAP